LKALITGGTGSLGNALVKAWLKRDDVERLIVFSRDELKQAQMRERFPDKRLDFRLGDVRSLTRLRLALHGIDTVIHAAALKRVDATANDPLELCETNIFGTGNVLQAALSAKVSRVLLISSDKACQPANAYGGSKFMAEQLTTQFNVYGAPQGTISSSVRYGNVLYSRGSVLNVWREQIELGEKVTLTDLRMTRFLITMRQAIQLIEDSLEHMEGGEIFVPVLPACTIGTLARTLWETLKPSMLTEKGREFIAQGGEIELGCDITGLRPGGEKLHETLLSADEAAHSVDSGCSVILPHISPWRTSSKWADTPKCAPFARSSDTALQLNVNEVRELLSEGRNSL
jgi:UDP-N-acetylglucosamine 4,6-dehydratase